VIANVELLNHAKHSEKYEVLALIIKKVNKFDIRNNTEIIRLYSPDSDIGGSVSVYMPKRGIWVDASAYMTQWGI
jgi:hypothetical protein